MTGQRIEDLRSRAWPPADLERVRACPVCKAPDRTLLYDKLWDNSALAAPGEWTLWRCSNCRSAYLDPRPTAQSIGRAYEGYYTHQEDGHAASGPSGLRLALANGYRNWRYGTDLRPSSPLGAILGVVFPMVRRATDYHFRYLPRKMKASSAVLDVGCGGGQWLMRAAKTGWRLHGADPDPASVRLARANGLDVREGGIDAWSDSRGTFDALTMSHVIEHVHDPRDVVAKARELLRPGGQLFVETPNIDAFGRSFFGRAWRGLEAPRHLVLFNRASLRRLLKEAGFERIRQHPAPSQLDFIVAVSNEIKSLDEASPSAPVNPGRWARLRSRYSRSRPEFLTFTCRRPR